MPTDLLSGISFKFDLFEVLKIALGAYLIWGAITGNGKVMVNEFPKCEPEKYKKIMRILLGITGPVVVVSGVLSVLGVATTAADDPNQIIAWVLWGLGLLLLVGLVVFNIAMTDRKAAEEAMKAKEAPRSAAASPYSSEDDTSDSAAEGERKFGGDDGKKYTYKSDAERGDNKDPRWY